MGDFAICRAQGGGESVVQDIGSRVKSTASSFIRTCYRFTTDVDGAEEALKFALWGSRCVDLIRGGAEQLSAAQSVISNSLLRAIDITRIVGTVWYVFDPGKDGFVQNIKDRAVFNLGFQGSLAIVNGVAIAEAGHDAGFWNLDKVSGAMGRVPVLGSVVRLGVGPIVAGSLITAWLCSLGQAFSTLNDNFAAHKKESGDNNLGSFLKDKNQWLVPSLLAAKRVSWIAAVALSPMLPLPAVVALSGVASTFGLTHYVANYKQSEKAAAAA